MTHERLIKLARWSGIALLVLGFVLSAEASYETHWQSDPGTVGDWFDAGNWTDGVPTTEAWAYVDNGGTALIASGDPLAAYTYAGYSSRGALVQSGGTHTVRFSLGLGWNAGADGTYELSGTGELSVGKSEYVGSHGTGRFVQTGGTNTVANDLQVGEWFGSQGTYELSGTGNLSAWREYVGHRGAGTFVHEGGTNAIERWLYVGYWLGANGTYELSGTGTLSAPNERVGSSGTGRFIHTGGTNTVEGGLYLGDSGSTWGTGIGTYELSGTAALSAGAEYIGSDGTGTFLQSGGRNAVGYLSIGERGRYELTGGDLDLTCGLRLAGEFDLGGSSTAFAWDNIIVDLSQGGSVLGAENTSLTLGPNSLTIVSGGFDPASVFGHYSTAGLTHTAGATLVVPAGDGFAGGGMIEDHVRSEGTITVCSGGTLDLHSGLEVLGEGTVALGQGTLTVEDEVSGMSGGQLSAAYEHVGRDGTGRFSHTSGTNTISDTLRLGHESGSVGTYELSGTGVLSALFETVGYKGTGTFLHTGGTNTVEKSLYLGEYSGSSGIYELGGTGRLSARWEFVGLRDQTDGRFIHTGGTNTVEEDLYLGYARGTVGTYELSGTGALSAESESVGHHGMGTFLHTGGINTVAKDLRLGAEGDSSGLYELSGAGHLRARTEIIGDRHDADGRFIHTGGTNTVETSLYLGYDDDAVGTYELSGTGALSAESETVGRRGTGTFLHTGGTNTVETALYLGYNEGAVGTYELSGTGQLSASSIYVGYHGQGELNLIGSAAQVAVHERLSFGGYGVFTASPGATIHMTGATFSNRSTDPAALAGFENLALVFETEAADWASFEAAGAIDGGFDGNFALGALILGGTDAGRVELVDEYDNGNRGVSASECLFTHTLIIGDGSKLDLKGLRLYVEHDVAAMLNAWIADGRLSDTWQDSLLATYDPTPDWTVVLPEPATLALLAAGLGAVSLRRRGGLGSLPAVAGLPHGG